MSVSVADILRLPSMTGATVVAGEKGIEKAVESINVLEYCNMTAELDQFFENNPFEGNELLITAFSGVKDDVETQCSNIKRYQGVGAVGLILYYVGILLPNIDQRLIDLCDDLNFPLISMPEGKLNLRYSEAIGEIMFEIFRERQQEEYFVSELLDQLSKLPAHQRNIDALLRMLSYHLHTSVVLYDPVKKEFKKAFWPRSLAEIVDAQLKNWTKKIGEHKHIPVQLGEGIAHFQRCPCLPADFDEYNVYLLKYGEPLSDSVLWQTSELVRLYFNIWNKSHHKSVTTELIRAIINNDVVQINSLAQLFHIRTEQLNQMWLFHPREEQNQFDEKTIRLVADRFDGFSKYVLVSYYEDDIVVFCSAPEQHEQRNQLAEELGTWKDMASRYDIVRWDCLNNTEEVQNAYLDCTKYSSVARKIYHCKTVLASSDILFSKECAKVMSDNASLCCYKAVLDRLSINGEALLETVETYLLDAANNMSETAKKLYVHPNTVKYRLHVIQDLLGYAPNKVPDSYPLYMAVSLYRLMH